MMPVHYFTTAAVNCNPLGADLILVHNYLFYLLIVAPPDQTRTSTGAGCPRKPWGLALAP